MLHEGNALYLLKSPLVASASMIHLQTAPSYIEQPALFRRKKHGIILPYENRSASWAWKRQRDAIVCRRSNILLHTQDGRDRFSCRHPHLASASHMPIGIPHSRHAKPHNSNITMQSQSPKRPPMPTWCIVVGALVCVGLWVYIALFDLPVTNRQEQIIDALILTACLYLLWQVCLLLHALWRLHRLRKELDRQNRRK